MAFIEIWLEDQEIGMGAEEHIDMFDRNRMGCRNPSCVCAQSKEFARWVEMVKSLRNGRVARRAGVDIADIRRRAESARCTRRTQDGAPVRIINGWGEMA